MIMKLKQLSFAALLGTTVLMAGCGSSDDGKSNSSTKSVSNSELITFIQSTNVSQGTPYLHNSSRNPLFAGNEKQERTIRFDTAGKIPLYYVSVDGSQPPAKISNAITTIESRLGDIFADFTLITEDLSVFRDDSRSSENVGNGKYDEAAFKARHGIIGGMVLSTGTGFYDKTYSSSPQNMCANSSDAPYTGNNNIVVNETTHTYSTQELMWSNMGHDRCSWSSDMAVHEIAHGMGMYAHVEPYFGLWSTTAMDALDTIYSNPAGTLFADLVPAR